MSLRFSAQIVALLTTSSVTCQQVFQSTQGAQEHAEQCLKLVSCEVSERELGAFEDLISVPECPKTSALRH